MRAGLGEGLLVADGFGEPHDAEQGTRDLVGDASRQGSNARKLLGLDELTLQRAGLPERGLQCCVLLLEVRQQADVLLREGPSLEGAAHLSLDGKDVVQWLHKVVEGAELQCLEGSLQACVACEQDDLGERVALLGGGEEVHPVVVR